jgi:hypothetical protein
VFWLVEHGRMREFYFPWVVKWMVIFFGFGFQQPIPPIQKKNLVGLKKNLNRVITSQT